MATRKLGEAAKRNVREAQQAGKRKQTMEGMPAGTKMGERELIDAIRAAR